MTHALLILGCPGQATVRSDEALASARELAHAPTMAPALRCDCALHQLLRSSGQEARSRAELLIALATEHSFPLWLAAGQVIKGWALAADGRAADGIAAIRRGLADYRATGAELFSPYFLALLADALGRADQAATGLRHLVRISQS